MISKELFVETMYKLEDLDRRMNDVDDALNALSPDFCGFYIPEVIDIVVDLLKGVFPNKNNMLEFLVYDCNFLSTYTNGCVRDENDNIIDLSTWYKVYDFLMKNMEE